MPKMRRGGARPTCSTPFSATGDVLVVPSRHAQQVAQVSNDAMRAPRRGLPRPCIAGRDAGGDAEGDGATTACHRGLDQRVVSDDAYLTNRNSESSGGKSQRMQRRLAREDGASLGDAPDGARDRVRVSHRTALPGGKERYVGRDVELRTGPDRMTGSLDVLHSAIRMPADVDRVDFTRPWFSGMHGLDARLAQRISDPR